MPDAAPYLEHSALNARCPNCNRPVLLRRDDGRLLEPQPTPWGMQLPDGDTLGAQFGHPGQVVQ